MKKKIQKSIEKHVIPIPSSPITCLNCGTLHQSRYCPECGQRANVKRLNWKELFESITRGIFNTDKGFIYTLINLFYKPGIVIKEYLDGKRTKYFPPFPSMFILAAVYAALNKLEKVINPVDQKVEKAISELPKELSEKVEDSMVISLNNGIEFNGKFIEVGDNSIVDFITNIFSNNFGLIMLLATPFLVLSLRLFFGKGLRKQFNWAESFMITGFINTQYFIILSLLTIVVIFAPAFEGTADFLTVLAILIVASWDMIPLVNFKKKSSYVWRSSFTYIFFFVLVLTFITIITLIVAASIGLFQNG